MLTSLRGVYENGTVRLTEPAPATSAPVEVVVVFLDANGSVPSLASEAPDVSLAAPWPFTSQPEHMARLRASWQRAREQAAGMQGPPLSEEVLADREEGS